jgi:hypothetical protein
MQPKGAPLHAVVPSALGCRKYVSTSETISSHELSISASQQNESLHVVVSAGLAYREHVGAGETLTIYRLSDTCYLADQAFHMW